VVRAQCLLSDCECTLQEWLGFSKATLNLIEQGEAVKRDTNMEMVGTLRFFRNYQCARQERFGLSVTALVPVEHAKVVEPARVLRMLLTVSALSQGKILLGQRYALGVLPGATELLDTWSSSFNPAADLYEARRLLERSIALDPHYARAYAVLSNTHLIASVQPVDEDCGSPTTLERAHRLARKAVRLDPNLPIAHSYLGHVLTFEGQHEQSIAEFEKAIALNPNFTDWRFGAALVRAGEPARAIQVLGAHMRCASELPRKRRKRIGRCQIRGVTLPAGQARRMS